MKVAHIVLIGRKNKKDKKKQTENNKERNIEGKDEKQPLDFRNCTKKISQLKEAYELEKNDLAVFFEHLRKLLNLKYYRITSTFGFENPADTGMATGIFYAIISSVEVYIRNYVSPQKNSYITVTPDFITQKFEFSGEIAISITLIKLFRMLRSGQNIYKRNKRKVKIILRGGSNYERSSN